MVLENKTQHYIPDRAKVLYVCKYTVTDPVQREGRVVNVSAKLGREVSQSVARGSSSFVICSSSGAGPGAGTTSLRAVLKTSWPWL